MDPTGLVARLANVQITPRTKYEEDLEKGQKGVSHPACVRVALYMCRERTVTYIVDQPKAQNPTIQEVSVLYDRVLATFDEMVAEENQHVTDEQTKVTRHTLSFSISLERFSMWKVAKVVRAWYHEIYEERKKVAAPNLPIGLPGYDEHGYSIEAANGCAWGRNRVLNNAGCSLKEDPWMTFYKTGNDADRVVAEDLMPEMSPKMREKFDCRAIVRDRGYTFEQHAHTVLQNENRDIVIFLLDESPRPIPCEMGYKLLSIAVTRKDTSLAKALFDAQLPLYNDQDGSEVPFMRMLSEWDRRSIAEVFDWPSYGTPLELPPEFPEKCQNIAYHIALRYTKKEWTSDEEQLFYSLILGLKTLYFPNKDDYETPKAKLFLGDFYNAILTTAQEHNITLNQGFGDYLRHNKRPLTNTELYRQAVFGVI